MSNLLQTVAVVVVLLSTLAGTAGAAWVPSPAPGSDVGALESGSLESGRTLAQLASDHDLQSGTTYWRGERLRFDASRIVPEDASEDERTFELWRVTADGQLNQQIRTFTVGGDGTHVLGTGELSGRVALRYGDQIVYVHEGVGYLESPPDGSAVNAGSAAFGFQRQTLDFSWSDPSAYPGQDVTLSVTSNRGDFAVAVSGNGNLSYENLTTLFPESAYAENYDARRNDSQLVVRAGASTSYRLDTTPLEHGEQTLEFDVLDTATTETARLSVQKPADDSRFLSIEARENVGDVVETNLSCSHCFLVLGGPGKGFLDVVEIEDSNGDGYVRLDINTRYIGMSPGQRGYPSNLQAYTSPDDSVTRYSSSSTLEQVEEDFVYSYTKLSDLRDQQGLAANGRTRPVDPGRIRLTLASSDFVVDRSAWGSQEPLGSQLVVRDETDVRMLTLEPRRLDGAEAMAAPGSPRLPANVGGLHRSVGPRERVALGDHLVFRFDVSGVFGYFSHSEASLDTVGDNREEGIRLTLEDLSGGSPTSLTLGQTALSVYAHPASESIYVAVQTGGTSRTNLQEGRYRATLTLSGVSEKHGEYSTVDAYEGYPYIAPGRSESVSATATIEPPTASIVTPAEGDEPHLNPNHSLVVGGTTSLAPGGTMQLRATSVEYAWETSATATVDASGNWSGAINLTEAPGEEFTVTLTHGDTQFDERTYTVRPPLENASDGDGGSNGDGSGGSGPLGGSEGGILSRLTGLGGLAVPIGFGVGGLVFLWVAWKLVIRRLLI